MRGLSERVGPAWGTSAERKRKYEWSVEAGEKGTGTGGSAPLWQAACSHMHSDAETLQVPAWCTAARDPDVGSREVGSGEGGA